MKWIFIILPVMVLVSYGLSFYSASRFDHFPPWPPMVGPLAGFLLPMFLIGAFPAWLVLLFAVKEYRRSIAVSLIAAVAIFLFPRYHPPADPMMAGLRAGVARHGDAEYAAFARTVRDLSGGRPIALPSAARANIGSVNDADELEELHRIFSQHALYNYNEGLRIVYALEDHIELMWGSGMLGSFGVRYFDRAAEGSPQPNDARSLAVSPRLWVFVGRY